MTKQNEIKQLSIIFFLICICYYCRFLLLIVLHFMKKDIHSLCKSLLHLHLLSTKNRLFQMYYAHISFYSNCIKIELQSLHYSNNMFKLNTTLIFDSWYYLQNHEYNQNRKEKRGINYGWWQLAQDIKRLCGSNNRFQWKSNLNNMICRNNYVSWHTPLAKKSKIMIISNK